MLEMDTHVPDDIRHASGMIKTIPDAIYWSSEIVKH